MLEYKLIKPTTKSLILNILSGIVVNMIVIFMASKIFKNIYIESLLSLLLVSIFLYVFNKCIKPLLSIIMLPLNIITLGLSYPIINIIILKLISILMGNLFVVEGWFSIFFVSIFISIMTFIVDRLIGKEIRRV